jgi:hypothetical protein
MVAKQTEYTWDLDLLSAKYPFNMTMTKAPEIAVDSHLMKFNFDGTFHQMGGHHKAYDHEYFPDVTGAHREQLCIREITFNSLITSAADFNNFEMALPAAVSD